jgi:predicted CopG family antitoxin
MPSRNIAVRKDVYEALRRERRPQESFTKVLLRLMNQRGPLQELSGSWSTRPKARDRVAWRRLRGLDTVRGGRS